MSEVTPNSAAGQPQQPRKSYRLHWTAGSVALVLAVIVGGLAWFANSDTFAEIVRGHVVSVLENATGGRVEIGAFHWSLRHLEADADGVVLHGDEKAGETPYLRVEHLHAGISILNLLTPKIMLRDLTIDQPRLHLIIYPDQTTNQPHPHTQSKEKSGLDTLFDLQAGHLAVEQGMIDVDNRAAALDFKGRYLPLDFEANDVSVLMQYVAAHGKNAESYHIDAGVRDLNMARGKTRTETLKQGPQVQGMVQLSADLMRNEFLLRYARVTAHARGAKDHTVEITGSLTNFTAPHWQAKLNGDLDLDVLDPVLGYPDAPDGIAHLNLDASGEAGKFRIDGPVHVEHASYVGTGVTARDVDVTSRVHADNDKLDIGQTTILTGKGGRIDADVLLLHWLPQAPTEVQPKPAAKAKRKLSDLLPQFANKQSPPPAPPSHDVLVKGPDLPLLVDGKITATFKNFAMDTVLDFVSRPPFKRVGVDAVLNGPATATWSHGDVNSLAVQALLSLNAPNLTADGEAPATGMIDATYTQRDGGVDVRRLELNLPSSNVQAHGHLGAFPLTSPTSLAIDVDSRNLAEFDTVLRALGLAHEGKSGAAALPVALHGEGQVHGQWTGSLISPHLSGTLKATQIGIEIPAAKDSGKQPQWIQWDSIEANGSYDAERIAILNSHFVRGAAELTMEGTITAVDNPAMPSDSTTHHKPHGQAGVNAKPEFDANSLLQARIHANKVAIADLLPLVGANVPVTGTLDGQFDMNGPLHSPGGSGWLQLTNAVAYDEPIAHARAEGTLANKQLHVSTFTLQAPAGIIAGSGSYDLNSGQFNAEAHGSALELAKVKHLQAQSDSFKGRLTFTASASGTKDQPSVEARADLTELALEDKSLGAAHLTAHTVNGVMQYDLTSNTETATLQAHGETELHGDFVTQAQVRFSRFNIGAVLKMAHVESISAESSLGGTATISGPLRRPEEMHGDLRVQQAAVTVAGVHLNSVGDIHAVLGSSRVELDPVHIQGDQTDMRMNGTLELKGDKKLDMAANGSINLRLAETLDKDLTASGTTTFQVEAHGPVANPQLRGRIDFQDGAIALEDIPNGLSHIQGTLEFNQNRLEVRSLSATTGGGQLTLGGYLAYQHGIYADVTATGKGIRIRYPQGVSSQADTSMHLQGTQNSLRLSGNVMITRFSVSQDLDIAALAAQANIAPTVAPPDAPSNHISLDVHIQSSPQLNFQNAFAKLAGFVDLRLRGTVASPSLLGHISITEGSASIAGTQYDLQRGEITFNNPVRIQPLLDLNATARVEDYDITLTLYGTPDKLNVSYRSDPPLPESDVMALLAVGRRQNSQAIYTQQQIATQNSSTDVLLGGALNATVSSRVQKLFGAGSVKVDPSYLGSLGNSTTRITVEEQLGRYVTLTYATSVDTSSQQLLQAEIAINRHVSLLVERDESGVFSMVLKNTRRYK